jgi:hypothetical protein
MDNDSRMTNLRAALARAGSRLVELARFWAPRAATGAKRAAKGARRVAVRARESRVAGETRKVARRAGAALKVKGRAVREQVTAWNWPRRTLAVISTRYPLLGRAWSEFLHSFSLNDRPEAETQAKPRAAAKPPAARRARTARTTGSRSNTRKAA